jgi:hypothetical protein
MATFDRLVALCLRRWRLWRWLWPRMVQRSSELCAPRAAGRPRAKGIPLAAWSLVSLGQPCQVGQP